MAEGEEENLTVSEQLQQELQVAINATELSFQRLRRNQQIDVFEGYSIDGNVMRDARGMHREIFPINSNECKVKIRAHNSVATGTLVLATAITSPLANGKQDLFDSAMILKDSDDTDVRVPLNTLVPEGVYKRVVVSQNGSPVIAYPPPRCNWTMAEFLSFISIFLAPFYPLGNSVGLTHAFNQDRDSYRFLGKRNENFWKAFFLQLKINSLLQHFH